MCLKNILCPEGQSENGKEIKTGMNAKGFRGRKRIQNVAVGYV